MSRPLSDLEIYDMGPTTIICFGVELELEMCRAIMLLYIVISRKKIVLVLAVNKCHYDYPAVTFPQIKPDIFLSKL